jgi:hypothetical protein
MGILALTPLAQAFWFVWAWRVIGAVAWPGPRARLQGLWAVAVLVVVAAGLDLLGVRVIPRRALRPWGRAVARIWLIASCIGCLAVVVVGALEWLSRPVTAVQQARIEPARRAVFRDASYLAGGLPLLAAAYGATAGRRYRVVTVDIPMANLPPGEVGAVARFGILGGTDDFRKARGDALLVVTTSGIIDVTFDLDQPVWP